MKQMKYFLMGALLIGFGTAAVAQDGTKADVDAVKALIKSKPADFNKALKPYLSKNKKNAENLVAFGRAFYEAKDTANAHDCATRALSASKSIYAPAYVLLGDIAAMSDDGGGAAQNYEQAIYADPKNPEPYRKYASVYRKIDPEGAVQKLEDLRVQRPDYPVDALIGHISYISLRYSKANEAYSKVPTADLTRMDFIEYAMSNYHGRDYAKALDIVKKGLKANPLNPTMTRIAMMCSNETGNFADALRFADDLFNKCDKDSVTLSDMDYQNYGKAFDGNQQFEQAIAKYKEALALPELEANMKPTLFKSISDSYKSLKDYPNAIDFYKKYLDTDSEASASEYASLGLLSTSYARTLKEQPEAMMAAFQEADKSFADLIVKFPDAKEFGLWQRGRVNAQMDADLTGQARPYFEELVQTIKGREAGGETLDDTDKARLFDAYSYMMRYFVKQKDNSSALENALRLQELQPDDAEIQKVVDALSKAVK